MKCITSPALDEIQIISYLEGEADTAIVAHIKECRYCAERANQLVLFQSQLRTKLFRSACPSSLELGDYHLGLLPAPQALVIARHLRECPHCRREIAELEEYLAEPDLLETVKVLIARLVGGGADPGSTPAFAALRGGSKAPLIFEVDGILITLDVQPGSNGQVSILGQLAAEDQDQWTGALAKLLQADTPERSASLDDLGAFRFEAVRPGSIRLKITSAHGIEVQIPDFDIAI